MGRKPADVAALLKVSVQRMDTLDALWSRPLRRAELESELDVSRTTAHRIVRSLTDHGLIERTDGRYGLTEFGEIATAEIFRVRTNFEAADALRPFLDAIADTPFDFDVSSFAQAVVTTSGPGDPYAPISRFMELIPGTDTLRGFDTTSIAPVFVDEIRQEILGGMQVSVVYLPETAAQIADSYPDELGSSMESGNMELFTSESLPFGLALFDDRIAIGAYDGETGMLTVFADTDDAEAIEWGERLYEYYLEAADPFEPQL